jgi:hypothetical protein
MLLLTDDKELSTPNGGFPVDPDGPCPAELVHRVRPDNVLLGRPAEDPDGITVPVRRPPAGHYLSGSGRGGHSARGLVEAGRLFMTMLVHLAADRPLDTKLLLARLSADVPCVTPPGAALALRWRRRPYAGRRITVAFDVLDRGSGALLGTSRYEVVAVTPEAYQHHRARYPIGAERS